MNTNSIKYFLLILLGFLTCIGIGVILGIKCNQTDQEQVRYDTIVKCDTITKLQPKETVKYIVRHDTLKCVFHEAFKAAADTLASPLEKAPQSAQETPNLDSLEICLPIEQKVYSDSTYQAWISGYDAKLDSIKIFNQNKIIYQKEILQSKNKLRLHISPTIGFGYGIYHHTWDCFAGVSISL